MNFCADYHFLEGIRLIKYFVTVLKILIPIVLIILGSIDFYKAVNNPDNMKGSAKQFVIRLVSALIIFLLPTVIVMFFSMATNINGQLLALNDCLKNANEEYITQLKGIAKLRAEANKKEAENYVITFDKSKYIGQRTATSGDVLVVAEKLWKQISSGNYSYGGSSIPVNGTTIDCSSYVSWVLYELGYTEEFGGYQHITQQFYTTNWSQRAGWEEVNIGAGEDASSKLQPGDIFVRDDGTNNGHINITVEVTADGKVMAYDCGSANNWKNSGGAAVDKTHFAKNDSRPGKIIRVNSAKSEGVTSSTNNSSTNNSAASTSTSSGKGKIIVLDPGHGKPSNKMSDAEKTSAGYTQNNGVWGEWRHFKTGTWGQECQGSGGPTDYACWYPMGNGDRDKEPEITLNYAKATKKYLEQMGYKVRMTRTTNDENPSFTKRASYAFNGNNSNNSPDAAAIICLHANAGGGGSGSAYIALSGNYTQKYIPSDYVSKSNSLGKTINDEIVSQTSLNAHKGGVLSNQGYLILFHKSPVPVAYMEIGFYDNGSDYNYITTNYDKIGKAVADGINKGLQ